MPTKKDILNENKLLNEKNIELTKKNIELKEKLQKLQDNMGYEICEHFHECYSLQKTAEYFCFENISDCYHSLVYYNGCSDSAQSAKDFKKYHKEIFGYEYNENDDEEDNEKNDEEDNEKQENDKDTVSH
jgi:hypothetical protein